MKNIDNNLDSDSDSDSSRKKIINNKSFESDESLGQESFKISLPYFKINSNNFNTINAKSTKNYDIQSGFFSS